MKRTLVCLALLGLAAAHSNAQSTFSAGTSADVWVYANAGSPGTDVYMRTWGSGGASVSPAGNYDDFSYGFLKWDLSSIAKANYVVQSATLTVTQIVPGFTLSQGQANPLEARALGTNWSEGTWNYSAAGNPLPGAKFGNGSLANYSASSAFTISIDLLQDSGFASYFNSAVNGTGQLALATTTTMDPFVQGGTTYYKYYSRDYPLPAFAPTLTVQYAPAAAVPGPDGLSTLILGMTSLSGAVRFRRLRTRKSA